MSENLSCWFWHLWDSPCKIVKHVCFSRLERTGMGILMLIISFNKLKMQLIFSNQRQMGLRLAFFYLTMLPATRDERLMPAQHKKCLKAPIQHGSTTRVVPKCNQRISELTTHPMLWFFFFCHHFRVMYHIPNTFPCVMLLDSTTHSLVSRYVPTPMMTSCYDVISIFILWSHPYEHLHHSYIIMTHHDSWFVIITHPLFYFCLSGHVYIP